MIEPARRRRAPRAERTSDVTRFRGVLVAALVGALVTAAVTLVRSRDGGAPGPLARPHALAGVACASCHDAPTFAAACTNCHGPHPSARNAHRELIADGALACPACHPGHGGGGVTLAADGHAVRYGAGIEEPAGTTQFRLRPPGLGAAAAPGLGVEAAPGLGVRAAPGLGAAAAPGLGATAAPGLEATVTVPLVEAAACARCHDLASARDPASACLVVGQEALGGARPTVCFDEHRRVRDASGAIAPRAAAWDAARDIAASVPRAPLTPETPLGPWPWLGLGILAAGLVWTGSRVFDRRAARKAPVAPAPMAAPLRLPVIDAATCLGCYACVDACPYDVLEIHRYVAFVARPADCCGLILCEQKCPNGSLAISFTDKADTAAIALADTLESRTVPGLYVAGDVGGQPLIRNAINQGAQAVRSIAAGLEPRKAGLDLVIVGAGPAGLAAALEAQARGLRYLALEQATIADSIRSFPRGKLVIDPDLPNTSALWLAEATKEELLARWTRIVREARPAIAEGRRVTRIARTGVGFAIDDVDREGKQTSHTAAHVVVAIGRRGTPRRLAAEIPATWAEHVHYSLADARSFAGRRVLVVGLGDVAMEAAVALSRQPGTEVVLAARAGEFRRGKARNIAEVRRRVASGTLRVMWHSEVSSLVPGRVMLATPTGSVDLACDTVFVLIGAIPAEDLLRGVGVLE